MKLTEDQENWLVALESGQYKQGARALFDGRGYCCLGVACKVQGVPDDVIALKDVLSSDVTELLAVREKLKLYDAVGLFRHGFALPATSTSPPLESLANMNDFGRSFAEIAAFIRANPREVFRA